MPDVEDRVQRRKHGYPTQQLIREFLAYPNREWNRTGADMIRKPLQSNLEDRGFESFVNCQRVRAPYRASAVPHESDPFTIHVVARRENVRGTPHADDRLDSVLVVGACVHNWCCPTPVWEDRDCAKFGKVERVRFPLLSPEPSQTTPGYFPP